MHKQRLTKRCIYQLLKEEELSILFRKKDRILDHLRKLATNWVGYYKIAPKVIVAVRMKPALPSIISEDQTGFQEERIIGENMRLNDYIISFCEIKTIWVR